MPNPAAAPASNSPTLGRTLRAADVTTGPGGEMRLRGAHCAACGTRIFPTATVCPQCNAEGLRPLELGATGVLYAYSTVHVARAAWETPYVIGYVDLPEGVRVFGKVDGSGALAPDMAVHVRVEEDVNADSRSAAPRYRYWFEPA